MAEIFLARVNSQEPSSQFFVIKKILPNIDNTNFVQFFKEEIKIVKNLNHKNIVQFVDYGNENGQLYIAMEFLNGRNLKSTLADFERKGKKMAIDHILYLISEVALGLDSAHRATDSATKIPLHVVHRDISPHNIMISFDGSIKIIDFGIARGDLQEEATKVGFIKGKYSYMSPEQASGQNLDSRTDVFALGIVLWELLTAKRLFKCANKDETLQRIQQTTIPPMRSLNPNVDEALETIILKALAQDKLQRYQSVADFQFDLNRYLILNYPDFRPFHFNDSVKQFYSGIIEKRKEKLKNLSSIFIQLPSETESTTNSIVEFSPVEIYDDTLLNKSKTLEKKSEITTVELPEGFHEGNQQKKSKLKKVKSNLDFQQLNNKNPFATDVIVHTKQKAATFYSNKNLNESIKQSDDQLLAHIIKNSFANDFNHFFALLAFFGGLYATYKYFDTPRKIESASLSAEATPPAQLKPPELISPPRQALLTTAYLNLSLLNAGTQVRIFIDNKKVNVKNPILNYPIYSNKPIKVSAYDPKTNYFDEKKIIAEPGKTINLELKLVPYNTHK